MGTKKTSNLAKVQAGVPEVIPVEKLPDVISGQFVQLQQLDKKINEAQEKAGIAKQSANYAYSRSTGLFQKGAAIEANQTAIRDLSLAQADTIEALQESFHYQEKLSEITKYLFGLGVGNIAMNRIVVREIQKRLEGAAQEDISDLARQEMLTVIKQLKAQEDIMEKQTQLKEHVHRHEQKLEELEQRESKQDELIRNQNERDGEQDKKLKEQAAKDAEHDRKLEEQAAKDAEHDRKLEEQAAKDAEHDRKLEEQAAKDAEHDQKLEKQAAKDAEHDKKLKEQAAKDNEHDKILEDHESRIKQLMADVELLKDCAKRRVDKLSVVAIVISAVSFVGMVLQWIL